MGKTKKAVSCLDTKKIDKIIFNDFRLMLIVLKKGVNKMATSRMVRVNELLKREIAEDLYRNFYDADFDTAALQ